MIKLHRYTHEINPVGRFLMRIDGNDVALFMAAKCLGTAVCLGALQILHRINHRRADLVIAGVFLFQVLLLCFLTTN